MSTAPSRKLGGVGRAGLGGAPRQAEPVASPTGTRSSSRAHGLASSVVSRPVQYTLRLSLDESDQLNDVARRLRRTLGRLVDQSEVLRVLVALAATDDQVRACLVERLTD
jgi:hypothetical protein